MVLAGSWDGRENGMGGFYLAGFDYGGMEGMDDIGWVVMDGE